MTARTTFLVTLLLAVATTAHAGKPKTVTVTNFPPTQPVSGNVAVTNLPSVQDVSVVSGCSADSWLAGFTAAQFTGAQGLLSFAAACVAEFPGSRVCSTRDIARTTAVPAGLTGTAWLTPDLGEGAGTVIERVTGRAVGLAQTATCNGWAQGSQAWGQMIDAQGRLNTDDCAVPRAIACCVGP